MEVLMAIVGDRVHVASRKLGQPEREGVVTGTSGRLIQVRWSTGEESTIVPGGSVSVGGKARVSTTARRTTGTAKTTRSAPAKRAAAPAERAPAQTTKA